MSNTSMLLAIALGSALAVAACGDDPNVLSGGGGGSDTSDSRTPQGSKGGTTGGSTSGTTSGTDSAAGTLPTNSTAGKAYYVANVHPFLAQKCATCHEVGPGSPNWTNKADANKGYDLLYLNGYVVDNSRIIMKGAHNGGTAPELTAEEKTAFISWVTMEKQDGGNTAQVNVLENFGTCFDKTKFDAIKLGDLRTIRRTRDNNPTQQNENANNCTGCNEAPCTTCHSGDEGSLFVMAIGNNVLPADYTFEESKKLSPPYIRQYFGTTPTGDPVGSDGIQKKSDGTVQGAAYSHPMFKLSTEQQASMKAFVDDAVAKFKAGTCGK